MDIRLTKKSIEVIVNGDVVKSVNITDKEFGKYMTELIGKDKMMLETMRFLHRKMKVISTTFKEVK